MMRQLGEKCRWVERNLKGCPMLLTDADIRSRGIIQNGSNSRYRDTGYDLTVALIIDTRGNDHQDSFRIAPSGIVELISAETVQLPLNVTGFAHVKTSLVDSGLLPLNIGMIDPGWNGRISATLLNFGDGEVKLIQKGDIFLRLTFIEHQASALAKQTVMTDDEYIKAKRAKISQNFGRTFLGWDRFKKTIIKYTDDKIRQSENRVLPTRAALLVACAGVILVAVQLYVTYVIAADPYHWIGRRWDEVATKEQVKNAASQATNALAAAKQDQQQIDDMKKALASLSRSPKSAVVSHHEP